MSWPGWEDFDPKSPSAHEQALTKRQARVRGAIPTEIDGHLFPSKHEAERYALLRQEERAGLISDLRLQFPFRLDVNGINIGLYVADFVYTRDGHPIVEDAKGFRTEMFRWKRRHFEAQYSLRIQET